MANELIITDKTGKIIRLSGPARIIYIQKYEQELRKKGATRRSAHKAGLAALETVARANKNAVKNPN